MTMRAAPVDRCGEVAGSIITRPRVTMRNVGVNPSRAGILEGLADHVNALAGAVGAGTVP